MEKIIKPRKPFKVFLLLLAIFILLPIGWVGLSALGTLNKISDKSGDGKSPALSFLDKVKPNQLQGEGDGRINILLLGIGGAGHPGGQLSDTIMIASFNPKDKSLAMLSIPRDLYVPIPDVGWNKINYAHAYGEQYLKDKGGGPGLAKKTVSEILDLPIHYYVRIDFSGFQKLVDALGGVTVNAEKPISDPLYPDEKMIGYEPFYLKAGTQKLDGKTALKYARSRETTSDFDRARRQQILLGAIKEKSLSAGVLANPKKIVDILGIIGNHVRTDMAAWEMERLITLGKDINANQIISKVLDNGPNGPLVSSGEGGYTLSPRTGNFKEIQRIAHEIFTDPYLSQENAKIEIQNASSRKGLAGDVSNQLQSYGYNVTKISVASESKTKTIIYDYSNGKNPYTAKFLADRFKVNILPTKENSTADFMIILGEDQKNSAKEKTNENS